MTRRDWIRTSVIGIAPAFVRAQTIQEKGRKLIAEAQQALGGDKFLGMRDRIEEGRAFSYHRERLSGLDVGRFETFYDDAAVGVKQRDKQLFGKKQDFYVIFGGGGKAWDVSDKGATPLPEELIKNWEESVLRNVMYILRCRVEEKGMIFERRAQEVFDNQSVEIVDVTDSDNREIAIYLNATTKLPVRGYFKRQNPKDKGWDEQDTRYAKYRQTQGVMWPWAITRSRNGERNLELYSENVQINTGLTASNFELSAATKLIPTKKPAIKGKQ